jgi:hypothetical protein
MSLDEADKLGSLIGGIIRTQDEIKSSITPNDPSESFQIISNEQIELSGTMILNSLTIATDSFVLNHVVYGNLNSAVFKLDGGYGAIEPCEEAFYKGENYNDSSSNARNILNIYGTATIMRGAGKITDAFGFSTSYGSLQIPVIELLGDQSMCCWMKAAATEPAGYFVSTVDKAIDFSFGVNTDSSYGLRVHVNGGSILADDGVSINNDTWNHVAFTYDLSERTIKFYVNGTLTATKTHSTSSAYNLETPTAMYIGNADDSGTSADAFIGLLDDIRIYSKVLSQTDINFIYNSGSGTTSPLLEATDGRTLLTTVNI